MPNELNLLRLRRGELAVTENNLRAQLDAVVSERADLDRIEGVLEALARRFEGATSALQGNPESDAALKEPSELSVGSNGPRRGTARPEGIPTVAEMVDIILRDAEHRGVRGLPGQAIVKAVNDRWWPGVDQNNILPTALRHVKQGRLGREGAMYVRVPNQQQDLGIADRGAQTNEAAGTNPEERMPTASITGTEDGVSDQHSPGLEEPERQVEHEKIDHPVDVWGH